MNFHIRSRRVFIITFEFGLNQIQNMQMIVVENIMLISASLSDEIWNLQ